MKRFYWLAALVVYGAIIFYLSSLPTIPSPPLYQHPDKLSHWVEYVVFGWFALKAFLPSTWKGVFGSLLFSFLYAASDELHQSFVLGRSCSFADWIADSIGILTSLFIYYRHRLRLKHFKNYMNTLIEIKKQKTF